jgi:hypothetical protein
MSQYNHLNNKQYFSKFLFVLIVRVLNYEIVWDMRNQLHYIAQKALLDIGGDFYAKYKNTSHPPWALRWNGDLPLHGLPHTQNRSYISG